MTLYETILDLTKQKKKFRLVNISYGPTAMDVIKSMNTTIIEAYKKNDNIEFITHMTAVMREGGIWFFPGAKRVFRKVNGELIEIVKADIITGQFVAYDQSQN